MTHSFHDRLDGFDERQILKDGCRECEARGKDLRSAFAHMDLPTFRRAWRRAFDLEATAGDHSAVGRVSNCEVLLLDVLWALQVKLQQAGYTLDGELPTPRTDLPEDLYRSIEQERWRKHDEAR